MKHRKALWKSCVLMLCLCAGYMLQHGQMSFQPRKTGAGVVPAGKPAVSYAKLPLSFEANQGQTDARVKFLSRGPGYTLFLTGDEVALELQGSGVRIQDSVRAKRSGALNALRRTTDHGQRTRESLLRLKLVNANRSAAVVGASALPGKANYFIGNDPRKWQTNVPTYAKVKYEGVYPGVDLIFYGNQRQLEHDFVVAPGADPGQIALHLEGCQEVSLDGEGNLNMKVGRGEVQLQKPLIYQEGDGGRREIPGRYILRGTREIAFKVGDYDPAKPLVVDPVLATCAPPIMYEYKRRWPAQTYSPSAFISSLTRRKATTRAAYFLTTRPPGSYQSALRNLASRSTYLFPKTRHFLESANRHLRRRNPADLAPGALVSIKFETGNAGQGVARQITILAVPELRLYSAEPFRPSTFLRAP